MGSDVTGTAQPVDMRLKLGGCERCKVGAVHLLVDEVLRPTKAGDDPLGWRGCCDHEGCDAYLAPDLRTVAGWDAAHAERVRPGPPAPP